MNSASSQFTKNVSKSMFAYYSGLHLYGRLVAIKMDQAQETHHESQFHQFVTKDKYKIPTPIDEYLRSIVYPQFQFNKKLFEQISDRVTQAGTKIKLSSSSRESVFGSIAQVQWQERDRAEVIGFNRGQQYSEGTVHQLNNCAEDNRITLGALMCAFRFRKDVGGLHCYNCYDFNNYREVPEAWQLTRNRINTYGHVEPFVVLIPIRIPCAPHGSGKC
ncbi:hypothetical protein C0J52_09605 [Blattella germanica]|nr:hypothetical protein C0J52_09605 [Blattella germanica]